MGRIVYGNSHQSSVRTSHFLPPPGPIRIHIYIYICIHIMYMSCLCGLYIYIIYRITHKHMHIYITFIYLQDLPKATAINQAVHHEKNCQARGRLPSAYVIETSTASLEKDHELVGSTWNHLVSKGWKDWIFVAWQIILRWKLTPLQKIPWIFKVPWFFEFEDFHLVQPSQGEKYPKRVSVVK